VDLLDQFRAHVDTSGGPDACHPWTGPVRNAKSYGKFRVDGRDHLAHRWLLGYLRGKPLQYPLELGCHTCDNPPCCNLRHLYVGTVRDNVADAIARSGHPAARRSWPHCTKGHKYVPENTFISAGRRYCRTCHRERARINARAARVRKRAGPDREADVAAVKALRGSGGAVRNPE